MDLPTLRANLKTELGKQKVRQELMITKALIKTLDTLVESLVDRLKNPNKQLGFIGTPKPPAEGDAVFAKCKEEIGKALKYALFQRSDITKLAGPEPPQYAELRKILPPGSGTEPDKYSNSYANFLNGMSKFITMIQIGGYPSCKGYTRVLNLLMQTTKDDKYKFNFDALLREISTGLKPFKAMRDKAEVDEIIDMVMTANLLDARSAMPQVPSRTVGAMPIEEPAPSVSETDITSELSTPQKPASVQKTPLTSADNMKIAGIAAQLVKDPRIQQRKLTMDQIRQMAENIYRRKTGMGRRKTYRKKKSPHKSRKVRRM
jgi:hypothetical protein